MRFFQKIILAAFFTVLLPSFAFAAPAATSAPSDTFGTFEVGLPGSPELAAGASIDKFIGPEGSKPILKFINTAVNVVIAVLVIIGVISIVIGGYMYMTAGGDGGKVKLAKETIAAALVGIFLSLISVVILNTINTYLGTGAQEPVLGETGEGGGAGAGDTGTGGLPNSPNNDHVISEEFSITPQTPLDPQAYNLPADNNQAITVMQSNVDSLYNDVFRYKAGDPISSQTMEGFKQRGDVGIEQIHTLRSRQLDGNQKFLNDTSANKFSSIMSRLSDLKISP